VFLSYVKVINQGDEICFLFFNSERNVKGVLCGNTSGRPLIINQD
jgi:hypothetical protein